MPKTDSRFIRDLFAPFAPSIRDGQVITAYVDEPITPYVILGDNFSTLQGLVALLYDQFHSLQSSSS